MSDLLAGLAVDLGCARNLFCRWIGIVPSQHGVCYTFRKIFIDVLPASIDLDNDVCIGLGIQDFKGTICVDAADVDQIGQNVIFSIVFCPRLSAVLLPRSGIGTVGINL